MSIAIATVTANEDDAADYLTVGHWMHIAVDVAEFSFTGAEIGAFVDGPELMAPASPANLPAQRHGVVLRAGIGRLQRPPWH